MTRVHPYFLDTPSPQRLPSRAHARESPQDTDRAAHSGGGRRACLSLAPQNSFGRLHLAEVHRQCQPGEYFPPTCFSGLDLRRVRDPRDPVAALLQISRPHPVP